MIPRLAHTVNKSLPGNICITSEHYQGGYINDEKINRDEDDEDDIATDEEYLRMRTMPFE